MNTAILKALMFCPSPEGAWGLPVLLWGEPGTGKTAMLRAVAKALGLYCYRVSPAEKGEGFFGVVPVPGADGCLHYPPPIWTQQIANGGVLFVDEISTAAPALQAPLLGLVQLRTIGDHQLGNRVRVIGAANETADAAGGWDLAPALCNRFGHFDFDGLDVNDWTVGLLGGFSTPESQAPVDAVALEQHVMAAWPAADAYARGMVAGFITRRPELLHKRPARGGDRAWPSRRSVEYATVALASARVHGLSEMDTDALMSAFVGVSWVSEFRAWTALQDLPDPVAVLDGTVKFAHDERRLDRTMALLGACAALVIPDKAEKRLERGAALWALIGTVIQDAADIAIPPARALLLSGLVVPKASGPTLVKLLPILTAAGIQAKAA